MKEKTSTSKRREEARLLKSKGLTYKQVGERMGISRQRALQLVGLTKQEMFSFALSRDNKCEKCGATNVKLSIHHRNYITGDVMLLCSICHGKQNWIDKTVRPKKLISGKVTPSKDMLSGGYLTTSQASRELGYSDPAVIRLLILNGKIVGQKKGRDLFIHKSEIKRFKKERYK